jgi:hypothetical protein
MQRIHDATASASLPLPPALVGTLGYWTEGSPGVTSATLERAWWFNMIQEEFMSLLAAGGITPDTTATNFVQVLAAINALIAGLIAAVPHGVVSIGTSGTFIVPAGVTALDVELWAGGSGSWASVSGIPGGGGSGGGYARKKLFGLTPGATITVTIGAGGSGGTSGAAPGAGGSSSVAGSGFSTVSATGGVLATVNTLSNPAFGNKGGVGSGGDLNLHGGDGGNGGTGSGGSGLSDGSYGGCGGNGPLSGGCNETAAGAGVAGYFPGGGAAGAGTGTSGTTPQNGAAGAQGNCIVRW